jgi:hypothetical protein
LNLRKEEEVILILGRVGGWGADLYKTCNSKKLRLRTISLQQAHMKCLK